MPVNGCLGPYASAALPPPCEAERPHRGQLAFEEDQFSIAPGQAAVFYDGERVLGGGLIQREGNQPSSCT